MPKMSSRPALLMGLSLACVLVSPAIAQDTPSAAGQQASPAAIGSDLAAAPCEAPKKKKKKGFGLGGLLKAAQSSGLTNFAGMGGMGRGCPYQCSTRYRGEPRRERCSGRRRQTGGRRLLTRKMPGSGSQA